MLLTGFNDARTAELVREICQQPERSAADGRLHVLRASSDGEHGSGSAEGARTRGKRVRASRARARACRAGNDPRVRKTLLVEVGRGQDFFRSGVIEALGDYGATYAVEPLLTIARQTGPLQVDAVIALGKLKDQRAMETLAGTAAQRLPRNPADHRSRDLPAGRQLRCTLPYLIETLQIRRKKSRIPGAAAQLRRGIGRARQYREAQALGALFDVGWPSVDPPRAPMALGAATVAIRNTPLMLSFLESYKHADAAISLIAEGFDMLEEDYEEESFFVAVRRGYWQAGESSPARRIGQALIDKLEF